MMKPFHALGGAALLALALAACNGKPTATASKGDLPAFAPSQPSYASAYSGPASGQVADGARAPDPRDAPVPQVNGKPMWAANRKHTAEENAAYQFNKNGGDFGARTETDYVMKVHRFVEQPPRGVETLDRGNGDRLMYDPGGNVFAVVSRTGAPRTMFKPRDGAAYWAQQKDREANRAKGGSSGADQS